MEMWENKEKSFRIITPTILKKAQSYCIFSSFVFFLRSEIDSLAQEGQRETLIGAFRGRKQKNKTRVYKYDFSLDSKYRLKEASTGDIIASTIPEVAITDDVIDWSNPEIETVNYVFAKVVDGDATDVFVILAK